MTSNQCNLCGGHEQAPYLGGRGEARFAGKYQPSHHAARENFPLVRCTGCGLIFASPRPDFTALADYYASFDDAAYQAEEESRCEIARQQLSWMEKLILPPGKRLLEIGAATGIFLAEAKQRGYMVSGIELSDWGRRIAKEKYNLTMHDGTLQSQKFPDASFDVICLMDVIEHLDDPRETMAEAARVLAPRGLVFLLTPDIGHWHARAMGARWWGIQQSHLFYFSRGTMTNLLEMVGLRVVAFGAGPRVFSLAYWAHQIRGYNRPLGVLAGAVCRGAVGDIKIGMKFPDHMLVLAQKP